MRKRCLIVLVVVVVLVLDFLLLPASG